MHMTQKPDKKNYHHTDLRSSLLAAAHNMLKEGGIEHVSLRKLADKVGASRTAPYHYFKNKNELLCAIAEQGFDLQQAQTSHVLLQSELSPKEKHRLLIRSYITFALENPELYDLMFGRNIWKINKATTSLHDTAYAHFQKSLENTQYFQQQKLLPTNVKTLNLHKLLWATMHGLAKLMTDGVYANASQIDEMCECTVNMFSNAA